MKKLFNVNHKTHNADTALLITRVGISSLMLVHGLPKMFALFSGEPVQFPAIFGMSPVVSLTLAVFAEVIGSLFVLFGFGTRLAVIPLIITMAVAVFNIHAADPYVKKEPGLLFLLGYVTLFIMGSGKYSIDNLIFRKVRSVKYGVRRELRNEEVELAEY